ncbi:MAG: molybdopterin-guanine dinucleotide biosynthesis protein B [Actinobacteria bacterium]|nr:molybdopterin-guanine dinucleotide biosynthesis protein B [Actinomycetota bacterium]
MRARTEDVSLALLVRNGSEEEQLDAAVTLSGKNTLVDLVKRMLNRHAAMFAHVYVVTEQPQRLEHLGVPVIGYALQRPGVNVELVELYSAVLAAPTERVICLTCTMGSVSDELLHQLTVQSRGHEITAPTRWGLPEFGCAVYARSALPALRAAAGADIKDSAAAGRLTGDVLAQFNIKYLEIDSGAFGDPDTLLSVVRDLQEPLEGEEPVQVKLQTQGAESGTDVSELRTERLRHLAPRIRTFMEAAALPVVSFVGKKKTGKTTVLVRVVAEMVTRGYRVAIIKHDMHGFDADVRGTDTYRLREAGATVTGISSPDKQMWIILTHREQDLWELIRKVDEPVDLIITEGFKRQDAPKIEVARRERSEQLICQENELLGIVSDMSFPSYGVPRIDINDTEGICDLLEAMLMNPPRPDDGQFSGLSAGVRS